MNQPRKILHMDDEELQIEPVAEFLKPEGYQVLKALTIPDAKQILNDTWVHLMIVDLNMKGGDDDADRSGLEIVNDPAYASVPKVILTGYADDPKVLRQMIPTPDGKRLVLDFLGKNDGDIANKIMALFNRLPFNWDLRIVWAAKSLPSILSLAGFFISGEERTQLVQRLDELEDLFRKIFLDCPQVTIERLLTYQAGIAWLEVTTHRKGRVIQQFVVACGQKQFIQQQMCRHDLIPYGNPIRRVETVETLRFAATVYECLGVNVAESHSLQYLLFRWSAPAIEETIQHLFSSPLAAWHKQRGATRDVGQLKHLYEAWPQAQSLHPEEWTANIKDLCHKATLPGSLSGIGYAPEQLTLHISNRGDRYPNPAHFLLTKSTVLNTQFLWGVVHGQLQPSTIFVDLQEHDWLIDFSQVKEGPLLLDFVSLEVALKTELMSMTNIETWYAIEKRLFASKSLHHPLVMDDLSPEVQKLLTAIGIIRQHAAGVVDQSMRGYFAGLFVHTMTQLALYDPDKMFTGRELSTYLYHLLSAAMVCDHLSSPREFVPNIDERFVIVEGKKLTRLSSSEWKLIEFMYHRVGQLCEYKDILKEVYGDTPDSIEDGAWMASSGKPKVNAAIGRLRDKLEPDPKNPTYIVIEREYGYKLVV